MKSYRPTNKFLFAAIITVGIFFRAIGVSAAETNHIWYKVKRGDELGKILHVVGVSPLWGKKGSVRKTIALNRGVITKKGILKPGTKIMLSVSELAPATHYTVTEKKELKIHSYSKNRAVAKVRAKVKPAPQPTRKIASVVKHSVPKATQWSNLKEVVVTKNNVTQVIEGVPRKPASDTAQVQVKDKKSAEKRLPSYVESAINELPES